MSKKKALFGVLGLGALGVLAGCQQPGALKAIAAGYAPCRADEIIIGSESTAPGSGYNYGEWDAWCRGEQWHCAGAGPVMNCRRVEPVVHTVGESTPSGDHTPPRLTQSAHLPPTKLSWVTYESNVCGVSARFPEAPQTSSREVTTPSGPVSVETASYDEPDGSGSMGLDCTVIGKTSVKPTRLLDAARNGMISKVKGELLSERAVGGGREVRFRFGEHEALARLYLDGDKLLVARVVPVDAFPEESTQCFFDSLESL